ncbi:MAG: alpha/beta hydrolase [Pseudomonadota bacterium]
MTLEAAPFYSEVARGAIQGAAYWLTTSDKVRIRMAAWSPDAAKGTVLLFPGRTEYIEKYSQTAEDFAARGFATIAIDWRGQGLADRMLDDRRIGHILEFTDYQKDVAAVMEAVRALDLPEPYHLLGHSMGGAIGLRAMMEGLTVHSAAFTGPMWGISMPPALRAFGKGLSYVAGLIGRGGAKAPTTRYENYVFAEPFDGNTLTTDREMYEMMRDQMAAHPELALGGPSLNWVREALDEADELAGRDSPPVPCICFVGVNERIVDIPRAKDRMQRWPGGQLEMVEGSEHEVLMEAPAIRTRVMDRMTTLFGAGSAQETVASA